MRWNGNLWKISWSFDTANGLSVFPMDRRYTSWNHNCEIVHLSEPSIPSVQTASRPSIHPLYGYTWIPQLHTFDTNRMNPWNFPFNSIFPFGMFFKINWIESILRPSPNKIRYTISILYRPKVNVRKIRLNSLKRLIFIKIVGKDHYKSGSFEWNCAKLL